MPIDTGSRRITIDGHSDLLCDVVDRRKAGATKVIETEYLPDLAAGGITALIASIFVDSAFVPEMALKRALAQVAALHQELEESPGRIALCTTAEEILQANGSGQIAIVLSFEGAEPIGTDLSLLQVFHKLGVRGLGLVWSRRNSAADGCAYGGADRSGGLTGFGIELVREAERLGMFIDVSHLSDHGLEDMFQVATRPFLASHSNARSLCDSPRNLDDGQLREMARRGCLVGVNAASILVAERDEDAHMGRLLDHVDHLVDVMGADHVALGFDLCDRIMALCSPSVIAGMPRPPFDVIRGHRSTPMFLEGLQLRGYREEDIRRIAGTNLLHFLQAVLRPPTCTSP